MSGNIIKFSRNTENAPKSSVSTQTVAFSHYNNISAQLPVDPITGEIVAGDVKEQAKQCLTNIKAIVESVDHVMSDVININIFLKNISDIDAVDAVYATFFQGYLLTRMTVAVAALPMDALVQIDAVISNGEGTPSQELGDLMDDRNYRVQNFMREMAYHYQVRNSMRDQMRIGGQFFFDHSSFKQSEKVAKNTANESGKFAKNPEPYPVKIARNTENAPKSSLYTQTVAFSHYNNISAQLPVDPITGGIVAGGVKEQARQCLKNIKAILESIDVPFDDIVKINIFLRNLSDIEAVNEIYTTFFPDSAVARTAAYVPARTIIAASALPMDALIQINAVVSHGDGTPPQIVEDRHRLVIRANNTENAPKSSLSTQTVAFSHYNHIAAQLPIDPKSGGIVAGGVKEQARQCLKNIKAILESIDVPFDDIVKINIFLRNLSDIEAVNEIYTTFFPDSAVARTAAYVPARTIIAASALPMDALIQINAVVSHGDGTPPQIVEDRHRLVIRANNTENAPKSSLSTQTVAFSHYNHIAAQLPIDPKSGGIVAGGVKEQARQCLKNIKAIVESVAHVMDDIVKVNIQLKNIADIDAVNEVYTTFFKSDLPARTTIGVSAISMDALVQIDAIISNGESTPPGL